MGSQKILNTADATVFNLIEEKSQTRETGGRGGPLHEQKNPGDREFWNSRGPKVHIDRFGASDPDNLFSFIDGPVRFHHGKTPEGPKGKNKGQKAKSVKNSHGHWRSLDKSKKKGDDERKNSNKPDDSSIIKADKDMGSEGNTGIGVSGLLANYFSTVAGYV